MSSSGETVYVVTGANRGLGYGLVEKLAARPNTIVFAGVRDVSSATQLNALASSNKNIHVLKITSGGKEDNVAAAETIKNLVGKVDVLIANAGIANEWATALESTVEQLQEHHTVNTIGPLLLFQTFYKLLKESPKPLYTSIGTGIASLTAMPDLPMASTTYGSSKFASVYINRKIHFENPDLIVFTLAPGWVQTDMGNAGAVAVGMQEAPLTVDQSVNGMVHILDTATREKYGGQTINYDGEVIPY